MEIAGSNLASKSNQIIYCSFGSTRLRKTIIHFVNFDYYELKEMFLFNNSKRELISHIVRMIGNFLFQGKKKKKTRNFFKRRKERETQGEKEHIVKKINN